MSVFKYIYKKNRFASKELKNSHFSGYCLYPCLSFLYIVVNCVGLMSLSCIGVIPCTKLTLASYRHGLSHPCLYLISYFRDSLGYSCVNGRVHFPCVELNFDLLCVRSRAVVKFFIPFLLTSSHT